MISLAYLSLYRVFYYFQFSYLYFNEMTIENQFFRKDAQYANWSKVLLTNYLKIDVLKTYIVNILFKRKTPIKEDAK